MGRARPGFSLVELLVTLTIVGVLASLAMPRYKGMKMRAQSSQVIGEFDVVRQAVLNFHVDSSYFPSDVEAASIPPGLKRYLPSHFTFKNPDWELDYEAVLMGGSGEHFVGIAAIATDKKLADMVMNTLGHGVIQQGKKITFVIAPM